MTALSTKDFLRIDFEKSEDVKDARGQKKQHNIINQKVQSYIYY